MTATPLFRVAMLTLLAGFGVFMVASLSLTNLNIAVGTAAGLVALAGTTIVALGITGHDWQALAGLRRVSAVDIAVAGVLALANALSVSGWLAQLGAKLFPQIVIDLFSTERLIQTAMSNRAEQMVMLTAVVLLAPLAEELFFRGLLFHGLRERMSIASAAVLSGFIFSAYHLEPVHFLARFEIGIMLALLTWKTGSLWPAIAAHLANNALAMALMFAQLEDSDLPAAAPFIALAILVAGLVWLFVRPVAPPSPSEPMAPRRFWPASLPWLGALAGAALIVLAVDFRGTQLTRIDLTSPLIGTGDDPDDEARLRTQRAQLRAGERDDLDAYREARETMSRERFKAAFERLFRPE